MEKMEKNGKNGKMEKMEKMEKSIQKEFPILINMFEKKEKFISLGNFIFNIGEIRNVFRKQNYILVILHLLTFKTPSLTLLK